MGKQLYLPVNREDGVETCPEDLEDLTCKQQLHSEAHSWSRFTVYGLLLISVFANGIQFGLRYRYHEKTESTPLDFAVPVEIPAQYKHFWWNTEYSGDNLTVRDQLWESILPSHGIVAVDRRYAASRNWPESMYLPGDKSKGVYLLEGYHQLHCLKIIRTTMAESLSGKPLTYKYGEHIDHCLDYLLQTAICNADSTPLYTFGDGTAGHGQLHKCNDWEALEDFATRHPACYRDSVEDIPLGEHFGFCDDGDDGLIVGSPQTVSVV